VSPVYPGDQPRIAPYPPPAVPTPSPLYSEAAGPEPPECAGAALRARVTDTGTGRQGSFVILRVGVRGGDCTLRDDGLPVDGVSFFIGTLPRSACDYHSLELNSAAREGSSQHNLGFGSCVSGKLVQITDSMGAWSVG